MAPQYEVLRTPVTPVSAEALSSLLNMIKQVPDDETSRPHKERLQQKVNNAAQISFAKSILQQDHIQFLIKMNDEAKPRRSTKSVVLGKAKIMSYEDLQEARKKRAAKDAAAAVKPKRGRKRKNGPEAELEPKAKVARMSEALEYRAPEAQMY